MNWSVLYKPRFSVEEKKQKQVMWRVLCSNFLQRYISHDATVLDLGAGYCEFINNIKCLRKYAVDINPDTPTYAETDVVVRSDLSAIESESVDVVFCSNFFEHLPTKEIMVSVLEQIKRVLAPRGKLMIIQPNIRYAYKEYWDYFDHFLPLSHLSMQEALVALGFTIEALRPQFLPYTVKSRAPKWPFLFRLYLSFPPLHRAFGKQMFILASKAASS